MDSLNKNDSYAEKMPPVASFHRPAQPRHWARATAAQCVCAPSSNRLLWFDPTMFGFLSQLTAIVAKVACCCTYACEIGSASNRLALACVHETCVIAPWVYSGAASTQTKTQQSRNWKVKANMATSFLAYFKRSIRISNTETLAHPPIHLLICL